MFNQHEFTDFKWIDPSKIVVAHWVRMKCMYGCPYYGKNASCPPNVPTVSECQEFFKEYQNAVVFHFPKKEEFEGERHEYIKEIDARLSKLEREVFLSGHVKAFLLFIDACSLCEECTGLRNECKQPKRARPTPEAMGIDVFSTVREIGYPIEVLKDKTEKMNRYAFLLID